MAAPYVLGRNSEDRLRDVLLRLGNIKVRKSQNLHVYAST